MNKLNKENVIHFIHFHARFSSRAVVPKLFVRGTLQSYFKVNKEPRQKCQVNINAFFTQIAVIKVSYCKQDCAQ